MNEEDEGEVMWGSSTSTFVLQRFFSGALIFGSAKLERRQINIGSISGADTMVYREEKRPKVLFGSILVEAPCIPGDVEKVGFTVRIDSCQFKQKYLIINLNHPHRRCCLLHFAVGEPRHILGD